MENMFEKGCLVQLSASVWRAARKVNIEQLSDMDVSRDWLSTTKKLVDPDSLKPLNKVVNTARSYLTGVTLPFPLHGMAFIPKEMISRVDASLETYKSEFNAAIATFLSKYDQLREVAMVHLGDLFNEFDYPVDVQKKFCFVWRFVILNFYEYFETFKERNIFKDDQLAELVERAQEILGGQSAETIRSDDQIKEQIGKAMKDVEASMAEILSMPRRRIIMN